MKKNVLLELQKRCVRYWWVLPVYAVVYLILFGILEDRNTLEAGVHIISCPLDHRIPFCEYFILAYDFWFVFICATAAFLILWNKRARDYYQFEIMMITGMSLFLFVSWIYPNGLELRPETFPRQNVFTNMVIALYESDTPTNVFPSMHVYNSLCAYIALKRCDALKSKRWFSWIVLAVAVLIILSTMFLKQHSVWDVVSALVLFAIMYCIVYRPWK